MKIPKITFGFLFRKEPSEMIKAATSEFRKGNYDKAIGLIKRAIKIQNEGDYWDKLAGYQYRAGMLEEYEKTLVLWRKSIQINFLNQFSYDCQILSRQAVSEKNKSMKERIEAIIHIKTFISYHIQGEYDGYPRIEREFNDHNVTFAVQSYLVAIQDILKKLNERAAKMNVHYNEHYLEYPDIFRGKSIYERNNILLKDDKEMNKLVLELKKHPLPFMFK